jgi:large conductance mechanosensitive channel
MPVVRPACVGRRIASSKHSTKPSSGSPRWLLLHNTETQREKRAICCKVSNSLSYAANVLDLAVAVVMGVAFGAVVTALVKDLITPLIAAIVGKPDFSAIEFTVNGTKFPIGDFINALVSFILIAAAVYFFIVLPMNTILARMRRGEVAPDPTTKKCPECLSDVPIAARRCAFCTSPLTEPVAR